MADRRPTHPNLNLDFGRKSEWKAAAPDIATTSPHLYVFGVAVSVTFFAEKSSVRKAQAN
jgi:hypothetical protein